MGATIDIYGMYRHDNSIFENMQIPQGLNKEVQEAHIMMKCQDLEILYPDFNSLKSMIGIWSTMNIIKWTKLYATTNYNYDPLHPFDVTETSIANKENETVTNKSENKMRSEDENSSRNSNRNEKANTLEGMTNDIDNNYNDSENSNENNNENNSEANEQNVAAFNSQVGEPTTENNTLKNTTSNKNKIDSKNGNSTEENSIMRNESNERNDNENSEYSRERTNIDNNIENEQMNESGSNNKYTRTQGNMGSNTFQDLIEAERNILEFNIYEYIAESFKQTFCIMVY